MTYEVGELLQDLPPGVIEWLAEWHSFLDCCKPKCENLNGYPFSGVGDIPLILTHPQWGPVWNVEEQYSLVHPNCRCTVTIHVRIDFGKIPHVTEICRAMGIDPPNPEMFEVTDIKEYREQTDSLRANFGSIRSDAREIEYILYRVTGVLGRMGLPPTIDALMGMVQHGVLTMRMMDSMAMYLSRGGLKNLALAGVTGIGAGLTVGATLLQWGKESDEAIRSEIAKEQIHDLEVAQMALRRLRY